ncbi:MAG: hypothetical protein RLZZ312_669 [Bacteroidota bacterium]|jgi:CubicO group peptidase (beta-lactamase class C family)
MILVDRKIVMENYFNGHSASQNWYWASAGKTLTVITFGLAEQEGLLSWAERVSAKLGTGWTSAPVAKENLITNNHLLTMTSGLDDSVGDDVAPLGLVYKADAGSRWAYHNVYVKLQDVIAAASGQPFTSYFNAKLRDKIGMNGGWLTVGNNILYGSNVRSAARFGLLMLNKGKRGTTQILNQNYFETATTTSQNLNLAYGYMWWLKGMASYRLPGLQTQFVGSLIQTAPADMFMALGKNDHKTYVIPSHRMVVMRMGDANDPTNPTFSLSGFDIELWSKISALIR